MLRHIAALTDPLRRWAHVQSVRLAALAASVLLVSGVAAFALAPHTRTEEEPVVSTVVEEVALTPVEVSERDNERYWREDRVQRGDTVAAILGRLGVRDPDAAHFLSSKHEARWMRKLAPGQTISAQTSADGRLLELRCVTGFMMVSVKPYAGSFRIEQNVAPLERRILVRSGPIRGSLFAAIDAAQLDDTIAKQLSEIYASDVDFHKELRPGDRFTVIYEMYYSGGEPIRWGRVLAAELVNAGHAYQAVWFQPPGDAGAYYTPDGRPLRKAFLRSPLEYSRITSGFSMARFHPILQLWRAHRGIDYAAPEGSGVKATADGIVESAGRDRGYGNFVVLRHERQYTTLYGHLSQFGPGVTRGARVSQGQVIGYVGSTGLATGPHLHYEFRVNSVHEDPLAVSMPPAPPITSDLRARFDTDAQHLVRRLESLRGIDVAKVN
jgi:murein DD-endopeptidase MepM/ murein hydrolase activator NlpD